MGVERGHNGILVLSLRRNIEHIFDLNRLTEVLALDGKVLKLLRVVGIVSVGKNQAHEILDIIERTAGAVVADLHNIAAALNAAVYIVGSRRVPDTEADLVRGPVVESYLNGGKRLCKPVLLKIGSVLLYHRGSGKPRHAAHECAYSGIVAAYAVKLRACPVVLRGGADVSVVVRGRNLPGSAVEREAAGLVGDLQLQHILLLAAVYNNFFVGSGRS